jgi:hypothetical protein
MNTQWGLSVMFVVEGHEREKRVVCLSLPLCGSAGSPGWRSLLNQIARGGMCQPPLPRFTCGLVAGRLPCGFNRAHDCFCGLHQRCVLVILLNGLCLAWRVDTWQVAKRSQHT